MRPSEQGNWWAQQDSNLRLPPCEGGTLPLSYAPGIAAEGDRGPPANIFLKNIICRPWGPDVPTAVPAEICLQPLTAQRYNYLAGMPATPPNPGLPRLRTASRPEDSEENLAEFDSDTQP